MKGLCFNCDEPFTKGHKCKKLFQLELLDEDEKHTLDSDPSQEENPEISLNAIVGNSATQNMLLAGQIGTLIVKVLIDSGSIHCFINDAVVQQLNLPIIHQDGSKVVVANGERVKSKGMCP